MPLVRAQAINRLVNSRIREYVDLCKPKVVALMVFTALVGMLLAAPGEVPIRIMILGNLGIALVAGAAAAVNHLADRRIDAIMARTRGRPLPSGQLDAMQVLVFALAIGVVGVWVLVSWVNTLTAVLAVLSLVGYAIVYTLYLKRRTPQNIVIGGAAGATPPLLGWTAVTGQVDPNALLLFLIIFTWTPPHFWALALYRKEEYAQVGIPMLPVTHGDDLTRLHILLYTILLVLITILPFLTGMSGPIYLAGALLLGAGFLYQAILLMNARTKQRAIKTFVYSIVYLMLLFSVLLFDRYVPLLASQSA
ncbi:MAG: heme o synthase [Pseudomonadota bacterium]|nr:heme o synthase [Pseudomonadota bacterium]